MDKPVVTKTEKQNTTAPTREGSQAHTRQVTQPGPLAEIMGLHNSLGNRAVGQVLQAKLKVSQPDDKYEQEADRIADLVMRMPDSAVQDISHSPATVQRKCAACESGGTPCPKCADEEEKIQRKPLAAQITPLVQRRENNAAAPQVTPQVASQINALRGGGQPLPEATRRFFEPRFGADFSGVRVHTGREAVQMNKELKAQAFTYGSNIYFNQEKFETNSWIGNHLLAHELTHVIQQGSVFKNNENQHELGNDLPIISSNVDSQQLLRKSSTEKTEEEKEAEAISEAIEPFASEEFLWSGVKMTGGDIRSLIRYADNVDMLMGRVLPNLQYYYAITLLKIYAMLKEKERHANRTKDGALLYKPRTIGSGSSEVLWTHNRAKTVEEITPFQNENVRYWEFIVLRSMLSEKNSQMMVKPKNIPRSEKQYRRSKIRKSTEKQEEYGRPNRLLPVKINVTKKMNLDTVSGWMEIAIAVIQKACAIVDYSLAKNIIKGYHKCTGTPLEIPHDYKNPTSEEGLEEIAKLNIAIEKVNKGKTGITAVVRIPAEIFGFINERYHEKVDVPWRLIKGFAGLEFGCRGEKLQKNLRNIVPGLFQSEVRRLSGKDIVELAKQIKNYNKESGKPLNLRVKNAELSFNPEDIDLIKAHMIKTLDRIAWDAGYDSRGAANQYDSLEGFGSGIAKGLTSMDDPEDQLKAAVARSNYNVNRYYEARRSGDLEQAAIFVTTARESSEWALETAVTYAEEVVETGEDIVDVLQFTQVVSRSILNFHPAGWIGTGAIGISGEISNLGYGRETDFTGVIARETIGLISNRIGLKLRTSIKLPTSGMGGIASDVIADRLESMINQTLYQTYDSLSKGQPPTLGEFKKAVMESLSNPEEYVMSGLGMMIKGGEQTSKSATRAVGGNEGDRTSTNKPSTETVKTADEPKIDPPVSSGQHSIPKTTPPTGGRDGSDGGSSNRDGGSQKQLSGRGLNEPKQLTGKNLGEQKQLTGRSHDEPKQLTGKNLGEQKQLTGRSHDEPKQLTGKNLGEQKQLTGRTLDKPKQVTGKTLDQQKQLPAKTKGRVHVAKRAIPSSKAHNNERKKFNQLMDTSNALADRGFDVRVRGERVKGPGDILISRGDIGNNIKVETKRLTKGTDRALQTAIDSGTKQHGNETILIIDATGVDIGLEQIHKAVSRFAEINLPQRAKGFQKPKLAPKGTQRFKTGTEGQIIFLYGESGMERVRYGKSGIERVPF